ncbi:MAG TPA: TonB family protein [Alphaproteobacteria bacterium]|nr:TonB family protein [Alphaproteobacteria bacterium]
MPGVSTARRLVATRIFAVQSSKDTWAWRRRALARSSAFLLHAVVIALLLVHFPMEVLPPTPTIAVDLVMAPPPQPPAKTPSAPQTIPLENAQVRVSVSGNDPDREAGRLPTEKTKTSEEPAPEPPAAPPQKAEPARETPAQGIPAAPEAPDAVAAPANPPVKSPTVDPHANEAIASLEPLPQLKPAPPPNPTAPDAETSPQRPPARTAETSTELQPGQGGGDRYLEKIRQDIDRNRVYPPEARSLGISGTAQYAIFIDRQGHLLRLRLLQSSGADLLDRAGMQMIQQSAPFQPPPLDLKGNEIRLVVMLHIGP